MIATISAFDGICTGIFHDIWDFSERVLARLFLPWKGFADARVIEVDLRETMVDIGGQEIMTADKVTLRMNAVVTYKVVDAKAAVTQTDDVRQALYRDTQLVLRGVVGARELDTFLTDKDSVAKEIEVAVRDRAS